jgi:hypothetical protein
MLNNLQSLVQNLGGGSKIKPKGVMDFHPYRKKQRSGLRVTADDIGVLKALGNALSRRK